MTLPAVAYLHVRPDERAPLVAALRASMVRGWVEYDPTRIVLVHAGLVADPTRQVPLTVPGRHAVLDVLRWTNSTTERTRWPKPALDALKAVRARLEHGGDAEVDETAEPVPPSRFEVAEVPELW